MELHKAQLYPLCFSMFRETSKEKSLMALELAVINMLMTISSVFIQPDHLVIEKRSRAIA